MSTTAERRSKNGLRRPARPLAVVLGVYISCSVRGPMPKTIIPLLQRRVDSSKAMQGNLPQGQQMAAGTHADARLVVVATGAGAAADCAVGIDEQLNRLAVGLADVEPRRGGPPAAIRSEPARGPPASAKQSVRRFPDRFPPRRWPRA